MYAEEKTRQDKEFSDVVGAILEVVWDDFGAFFGATDGPVELIFRVSGRFGGARAAQGLVLAKTDSLCSRLLGFGENGTHSAAVCALRI